MRSRGFGPASRVGPNPRPLPGRAPVHVVTVPARPSATLGQRMFLFLAAVVLIQGIHVGEHIIQLFQVYVFGVAEDNALGLLGYVFEFQGTEEWLHLVFNSLYLSALYILVLPLWHATPTIVPMLGFLVFLFSVGLETFHVVEHGVIISNVIQNGGCPCPGIGDVALNTTDTILHLVYNVLAYVGLATAFCFTLRARGARGRQTGVGSVGRGAPRSAGVRR